MNSPFLDASDKAAYVFKSGDITCAKEFPFLLSESQASSSYRELLAIHRSFTVCPDFFHLMKGKLVIWLLDNQSVPFILNNGSKVKNLQTLVIDIRELAFDHNITIIPIWRPRVDPIIVMADAGSKNMVSIISL